MFDSHYAEFVSMEEMFDIEELKQELAEEGVFQEWTDLNDCNV